MSPQLDVSPVSPSALGSFDLVFDAVYTPMDTQLLQVGGLLPTQHKVCDGLHTLSPLVALLLSCMESFVWVLSVLHGVWLR